MNNIKSYIYLSICEISFKRFEKSKFSTYIGYCNSMKSSLQLREFSGKEMEDLICIGDYLKLIYNLSDSEIGEHLDGFFNSGKALDFYNYMILSKENFPYSQD